jgi:ribonuclease P protein component
VKRKFRLTRSTEIQRVRRLGKSYAHPLLVLVAASTPSPELRISIISGGRVGSAVQRNRAKRQLRACMDEFLPMISAGWNLIILGRRTITEASFTEIRSGLFSVLNRANLLKKDCTG